jgi:hypothetical protein
MNAPPAALRPSWHRLLLPVLVAISGTTALPAQDPGTGPALRQGVHFSVAMGTASVGASCTSCAIDVFTDRLSGLAGTIQLGGAVTPQVVVAGEFMGWLKNDVPIYRRIAALNLVFIGYPSARSGFFVRGGAGGLRAIVENDFVIAQTDAFASQLGIGYDIPMAGRLKLTPQVTYLRTFGGTTTFNGVASPEVVSPNAIQFGIALTIH